MMSHFAFMLSSLCSFHVNYFSNKYQGSERIQPVRCSKISEDCEQETEEKDSKAVQKIVSVKIENTKTYYQIQCV